MDRIYGRIRMGVLVVIWILVFRFFVVVVMAVLRHGTDRERFFTNENVRADVHVRA
jgi:hypothetical protein